MRKKAYTVRYIYHNKVIILFVLLLVLLYNITDNRCVSVEQNSQLLDSNGDELYNWNKIWYDLDMAVAEQLDSVGRMAVMSGKDKKDCKCTCVKVICICFGVSGMVDGELLKGCCGACGGLVHCHAPLHTLHTLCHQLSPKHTQLVAVKPLVETYRNGISVQFALYENIESNPARMEHHLDTWNCTLGNVGNVVRCNPTVQQNLWQNDGKKGGGGCILCGVVVGGYGHCPISTHIHFNHNISVPPTVNEKIES